MIYKIIDIKDQQGVRVITKVYYDLKEDLSLIFGENTN